MAPEETALVGFDTELAEQSLCWRELAEMMDDLAGSLRALSAGRDTPCVVLEATNTVHCAIGIAAVLSAQLPLFPLNPTAPPAEREGIVNFLGRRFGRVHVLDGRHRPRLVDMARAADTAQKPWGEAAPAYLLATGGSSGVPKISMHRDPLGYDPARTPSMAIRQTGWRTGQRQLIVGPLYHAAPFTVFRGRASRPEHNRPPALLRAVVDDRSGGRPPDRMDAAHPDPYARDTAAAAGPGEFRRASGPCCTRRHAVTWTPSADGSTCSGRTDCTNCTVRRRASA